MNRKLFINIIDYYNDDIDEMLKTIKKVGFDGVNFSWEEDNDNLFLVNMIKENNLLIDYIHAPYRNINHFWYEDSNIKDSLLATLKSCVRFCNDINVKKMVVHPFIGFNEHDPKMIGISYFEELLKYAKQYNILICFENVEGEEYLSLIFKHIFDKYDNARFCLDTGHELCYNKGVDQLGKYGKYLTCTHINDNIGVTGKDIWWTDDLHYIPGDGIMDIAGFINRLKKHKYNDNLSLELKISKDTETSIYNKYKAMSKLEYFEKAFEVLNDIKEKLDI